MPANITDLKRDETHDPFGIAFPFTLGLRIKYFITGVVVPAICIAFSMSGSGLFSLGGAWQSGQFETYVGIYLAGNRLAIFIPFFLFSMVGLTAVIFHEGFRNQNWVKGAIYSGALLSLVNLVLICITIPWISPIAALIAGALLNAIVWSLSKLIRLWKNQISIAHLLIATAVVAVGMAFLLRRERPLDSLVAFPTIIFGLFIIAGPTLNSVTYWRLAVAIFSEDFANADRRKRPSAWFLLAWVGSIAAWIAAYWLSVRQAIVWTLEEYQKLPTQQPDCYVCSAAANGHAKWVGSNQVKTPKGKAIINPQMQRLKALELILTVICPRSHRRIRAIYDRIGPTFAHYCVSNRWFADITFLLLKPVEWLAIVAAWAVGISAAKISRLYQ